MSGNTKKELILCDYCQIEKEGNQIYTARKQFAGFKIVDLLQNVTKLTIPSSTPVKICSLCASTLHATTGAIARAVEMVSKLMPVSKKQQQKIETVLVPDEEIDAQPTNSATVNASPAVKERMPRRLSTVDSPKAKAKQPGSGTPNRKDKQIKDVNGTPTGVQQSPKKLPAKPKLAQTSTPLAAAAPSTPKKQQDVLENSIKLTTAKDAPKKNKEFIQLFGANGDTLSDSEEEDEEEEDVSAIDIEKENLKNIATGFECKLCDFTSTNPIPMKRHLKELHGQKRPRIYNCFKCAKSFGVLKSLKGHLLTHGISEEKEEKQTVADPQLAVLTALKPKQKPQETVDNEYTFAITETNSSTPKPSGQPVQQSKFQCEMCDLDFNVIKSLQEHLKTVHNIERPKAFKCDVCSTYFMHKKTMDRHYNDKHTAGNGEETAKKRSPVKIKIRRKTVAVEGSTAIKETNTEARSTQTGSPVKITARRKTVASDEANEPTVQVKSMAPLKKPTNITENGDCVIQEAIDEALDDLIESLPMPKEIISKDDSATVAEKESKKAKKPTQLPQQSFESLMESPIKNKTKAESIESPSKSKSKSKSEQVPVTPTMQYSEAIDEHIDKSTDNKDLLDSLQITKKSKAKKETDTLDSSQTLENSSISKKLKTEKEVEGNNSPQTIPINGSEKKLGKRKQREEESLQSINKSKADIDVIDLLDEVNPNVKPHKRIKLVSLESELNCSMCSKVVSSRKRLDSHMRKKHSIQLTCPNCKVVFADNLEYVKHFSFCNAVDGLPCGIKNCEKVFAAANFLSSHLNKKHKTSK